ncbi:related to phosphatidylserine decarboxylase proenzyme [Phialocephala subalpina]|uniref:Related to phosphatidylserine decarboxylase proenzyme n=1 Tax=Phialocephala subalpina TaxID=576137 RepID=A0A1L7XPB5_9HELO|nr:related to phosphatidylserine decarboxylase proenzyme [Phialocephala subalpina]
MAYEKVVQELQMKIVEEPNGFTNSSRRSIAPEAALLLWVPSENFQGADVYNHFCLFYFVLDQPSTKKLQTPILPGPSPESLTWSSNWMVQYAKPQGQFLDTPESITPESLETFRDSPNYNMGDYLEPRGGWRSYNEFFARNFKPGYIPVAVVSDQTIIVSPADSMFDGQWEIRSDSGVTIKTIHWKNSELLEGSPFADRFTQGIFTHAFLNPAEYHHQHAPVGGKVVEARVIPGQVYLETKTRLLGDGEDGVMFFDAPDNAGYQFCQTRGLVVFETAIGLVAVLPMGMAQVSSIVLTAEVGQTLRKKEEISYFQFGGSDTVLVFEAKSNVSVTAQVGTHYKVGNRIAQAFPEL